MDSVLPPVSTNATFTISWPALALRSVQHSAYLTHSVAALSVVVLYIYLDARSTMLLLPKTN